MFYIPRHIRHTLVLVAICSILLAILLKQYWILVGAISMFSIREIFRRHAKKVVGVWVVALCLRKMNEDLKNYIQIIREDISPKPFDIEEHIVSKHNELGIIAGEMGSGKSYFLQYLIWLFLQAGKKVIVFSPKHFADLKNADFGFLPRVDVSEAIPNPFVDLEAFASALQVCFVAKIKNIGINAVNIRPLINKIVERQPKNWEDVYKIIKQLKKEFEEFGLATGTIENIIHEIDFPINRTEIHFDASMCLDFGGFRNNHVAKAFFMELFTHRIYNQELEKQDKELVLCIDEAKYLLNHVEQGSILNSILTEGRISINLWLATQNLVDIHEDLRQTGNLFEFYTSHNKTYDYLRSFRPFFADALRHVRKHEFIDLKQETDSKEEICYILKVDDSRFEEFLANSKNQTKRVEDRRDTQHADVIITPENDDTTNSSNTTQGQYDRFEIEERIIETLQKSDVAMYGYQIAKAVGLSPKDAVQIRQPLRNLVRDGKIREWKCQVRRKEIIYYYLSDSEQTHNFMTSETESKIVRADWQVLFKATHGTGKSDFIIEKDGKKIALETETFKKKAVSDLQDRVVQNKKDGIDTIIIVPTDEAKEFYQSLFECKVVLLPELEELLGVRDGQDKTA